MCPTTSAWGHVPSIQSWPGCCQPLQEGYLKTLLYYVEISIKGSMKTLRFSLKAVCFAWSMSIPFYLEPSVVYCYSCSHTLQPSSIMLRRSSTVLLTQRASMDVEGGLGDMDINCEELAGDRAPEAADSITPDEMKHCQIKKKLGVPELDPDALPSSLLNKYLIFSCIVARMLTVSIPPNPL